MNIILGIMLSLVCLYSTDSYWKSFLISAIFYCIASFILILNSNPEGSSININAQIAFRIIASLLGEFLVPFILACLIYLITSIFFKKTKTVILILNRKGEVKAILDFDGIVRRISKNKSSFRSAADLQIFN